MNVEITHEIQHALRALSFTEPSIPQLNADGVYGPETTRAVAVFQELYGLPTSGTVDPVTWDRLRDAYNSVLDKTPRPLAVFPHKDFVIRLGETHSVVPVIKAILNTLSERYGNIPSVGTGNVYDRRTAETIRLIRRLHDLEEIDEIDIVVWELLAVLYEQTSLSVGSDTG